MRIVLVGPPGAGKGTQAAFLAKNLSIPHISTGDLFRANISQGTELGKQAKAYMDAGNLVPDEVTIGMAKDRMEQPDAANGFLLDGFPRNVSQAEALDEMLKAEGMKLDAVLDLEVPEDEVVKRIAGRRICRNDSSACLPCRRTTSRRRTASATSAAASCTSVTTTPRRRSASGSRSTTRRPSRSSTTTRPRAWWSTISALGKVDEVTERAMDALKKRGRRGRASTPCSGAHGRGVRWAPRPCCAPCAEHGCSTVTSQTRRRERRTPHGADQDPRADREDA